MKMVCFGNGLSSILVNICHQEICLQHQKGNFQVENNYKNVKIWFLFS